MTKKMIALLVALMVVFAMLFSAGYVTAEAGHDCSGEDCPICHQIATCENTLHSMDAAAAAVIIGGFFGLFVITLLTLVKKFLYNSSLVSLKVKLSN